MIRKIYKIVMILSIAILLLNMTANTIYAVVEIKISKPYLEKIGVADYHLKYYNEKKNAYTYVKCSIVGFYNKGGFNPTYCMNKNLDGAEKESYYVNIEDLLKNDKVWRAIKNGYPYKKAKELGLSNDFNAYTVTKMAVYCILGESKLENFKVEQDDDEAVQMLKVLNNLVDIGLNGTEKQEEDPIVIEKIGELKEEEEYYSQEYSVNSKTASQEYYILTTSILPEGVYVANMEGKNVDTLKMGEHLKIMIPKEKLQEDLSIRVDIEAQCEAYLIYEGKTTVENTQNYVVTAGDKIYVEENIKLDLKAKKYGNIKIIKTDKENEEIKLEGIKFELYNEEKNRIGVYSTNANGEIYIEGLPIGKYTIKEIETNKWYNSQTKDLEVEVENKETSEVIVTNELKKGQIKIIKVDKDDKKTKLEGIKFEVQDKEGNILETLITDKNGEAITKKYAIKEYENLYIKEIETDSKYVLNDEIKEIKLEANQIKELVFENEKVKGQIKIVKTSKDENKMNGKKAGTPLEGVKFQIYSKNNKLLETLTTDKNGIAMSKELEKGEYIIKEIETNKYYFLNKKTFNAIIENNKQIVEVDITNESKNPDIDIEKNGSEIANIGENVEYDISFRNTGNTALDNFTMVDYIPYEYIDVTNFKTGTYNQDISYNLYYKSNLTDEYVLLMEDLRSKVNYEINLTEELASNEYITEIKMEFGTVDIGFSTNENPHITGLVREKVKSEEVFTNIADISAKYDNYNVYDKSKWKTTAYKFLPKTGF